MRDYIVQYHDGLFHRLDLACTSANRKKNDEGDRHTHFAELMSGCNAVSSSQTHSAPSVAPSYNIKQPVLNSSAYRAYCAHMVGRAIIARLRERTDEWERDIAQARREKNAPRARLP